MIIHQSGLRPCFKVYYAILKDKMYFYIVINNTTTWNFVFQKDLEHIQQFFVQKNFRILNMRYDENAGQPPKNNSYKIFSIVINLNVKMKFIRVIQTS